METIIDEFSGRRSRASLPEPFWEGRRGIGTGVQLHALYYGPRSGRCFARQYSQWDRGDGVCVGETVHEIAPEDLIRYAERVDVDLPEAFDARHGRRVA